MGARKGRLGKRAGHDGDGLAALIEVSMADLRLKTQAHQAGWRFGEAETWAFSQDDGLLVFTFAHGLVAQCPAQIIGTFNANDQSWLWAWANPSIERSLAANALKLRAYGEQHGLARLTTPRWTGAENDAWAMTALAAKLCDAQGAYRGPSGPTSVFLTFGEVRLLRRDATPPTA
jgi:hypothetical protein